MSTSDPAITELKMIDSDPNDLEKRYEIIREAIRMGASSFDRVYHYINKHASKEKGNLEAFTIIYDFLVSDFQFAEPYNQELINSLNSFGIKLPENQLLNKISKIEKFPSSFNQITKLLQEAATKGNMRVLKYAIDNGYTKISTNENRMKLDHIDNIRIKSQSILTMAAYKNDFNMIKKLVQLGEDPNTRDEFNNSLLWYFCYNGNLPAVQFLLKQPSIDVNSPNKSNWTTLMIAAFLNKLEIVQLLLQQLKINKYARAMQGDLDGQTAEQLAKNEEIKKLIQQYI